MAIGNASGHGIGYSSTHSPGVPLMVMSKKHLGSVGIFSRQLQRKCSALAIRSFWRVLTGIRLEDKGHRVRMRNVCRSIGNNKLYKQHKDTIGVMIVCYMTASREFSKLLGNS